MRTQTNVVLNISALSMIKVRWCMSVDTVRERDCIMKLIKKSGMETGYLLHVKNPPFCLYSYSNGIIQSAEKREIYKKRYEHTFSAKMFIPNFK